MTATNREHIVKVPPRDMDALRLWLADPNGACVLGAVSFQAVEDGGILVRTRSWKAGDPT